MTERRRGDFKVQPGMTDSEHILSVSGGKDSTALILAFRESGIECRYAFADTGWEAPEVYDYLGVLEARLGISIVRVGVPGGMAKLAEEQRMFPTRMIRWCTQKLKVEPLRAYHDAIAAMHSTDTVSVLGIRAEESEKRAAMAVFEHDDRWGGYVWRPIMGWSLADVLAIHHRHGVPVNPLYALGFERVGCLPCILARKSEIALIAKIYPERIAMIRAQEEKLTQIRRDRFDAGVQTSKTIAVSFFQSRDRNRVMQIDRTVEWATHEKDGTVSPIMEADPDSGCYRWGMCEPPAAGTDAADVEPADAADGDNSRDGMC